MDSTKAATVWQYFFLFGDWTIILRSKSGLTICNYSERLAHPHDTRVSQLQLLGSYLICRASSKVKRRLPQVFVMLNWQPCEPASSLLRWEELVPEELIQVSGYGASLLCRGMITVDCLQNCFQMRHSILFLCQESVRLNWKRNLNSEKFVPIIKSEF